MKNKIVKRFQTSILNWYTINERRLPWRGTNEPFKILVAEFLLQKTDVEKVKDVYGKFVHYWPSPQALSKARISSISKIIQPLGLRYKANRLKLTAKAIVEKFSGEIPESEDKLLELPGVGRYIACAVECFAFNKPKAVLDTNVIRILNRVFGIQSEKNRPRDDPCLWDFAQTLVPTNNAKEYNWGLLDYGALVCKSKEPLCRECVVHNICIFHKKMKFDTKKQMRGENLNLTSVDLFAGAGGLSLGFEDAGFKVIFAVENDIHSAETYKANRKRRNTELILSDISQINFANLLKKFKLKKGETDILLCGSPCQGFSTSNTRTRTTNNPKNHLFKEFLRAVEEIHPKWILFENVSGIVNFEKGEVIKIMETELDQIGYLCSWDIINTADYGVPQTRRRFFLIGSRIGIKFSFPQRTHGGEKKPYITVRDAISDLPLLENGNKIDSLRYRDNDSNLSKYQRNTRRRWNKEYCLNNWVTENSDLIVNRYKFIPPGGNWQDIPTRLMRNYKNKSNCHSGIYKRLKWDEPSIVVSNFRKNMLIHPEQDRGLSVREAARLQSFPDWYIFYGRLGSQQQQVANAVSPLFAKKLGDRIGKYMKGFE
jgi:DNA (cytosine-5)-methyltransferase 1